MGARTIATVGRIFHDLREPLNVWSHKGLHPKCYTPAIPATCLRIITLKLLWPLLRVILSQRDIDSAFKRLLFSLQDIDLFASDLPGEHLISEALKEQEFEVIAEVLRIASLLDPELDALPWEEAWLRLLSTATAIYIAMTFGWAGAPGHWQVFALAAEAATCAGAPAEPEISSTSPSWIKTHVDDAGEAELRRKLLRLME